MKILYVNWSCLGAEDAVETLKNMEHEVGVIQLSECSHIQIDWEFVEVVRKLIEKNGVNIVFTFNYFPTLAEACKDTKCKYVAWVYDNPAIKVYSKTVDYACNYIFIFDSYMCEELKAEGVENVYYMPLAVNTKRLDKIKILDNDKKKYSCDIAFVGSLYNESNNLYTRLIEKAKNKYLEGYLEGLIAAQRKIYGYNFLKESLSPPILELMYKTMPFELEKATYASLEMVYADYFLCRRIAELERYEIIDMLSRDYEVHLYTNNKETTIGKSINGGIVDYFSEMVKAFRCADINLNISLRSIRTGIPLRAMDIMGSRAFLLTNYQEDFLKHFDPGKDFVYYESLEDMVEKVNYYSKKEEERKKIAENGWNRIKESFSYEKIMGQMLDIVCKD